MKQNQVKLDKNQHDIALNKQSQQLNNDLNDKKQTGIFGNAKVTSALQPQDDESKKNEKSLKGEPISRNNQPDQGGSDDASEHSDQTQTKIQQKAFVKKKKQEDIEEDGFSEASQNNQEDGNSEACQSNQEGCFSEDSQGSVADNLVDIQDLDQLLDSDNEQVSVCQKVKKQLLEGQEQKAIEKLIKEYGASNICYDCVVGFTSKKSYSQHMRHHHADDALEQGLGDFICDVCNQVFLTKNRLQKHKRYQHSDLNEKKKQLSFKQQKFDMSYTSQSKKKNAILKKIINKNEK